MDGEDKKSPFDFRRAQFKAGIDADAAKKKRETVINQVRKQKQEDRWAKFRTGAGMVAGVAPPPAPPVAAPVADALQPTKNLDVSVLTKVRVGTGGPATRAAHGGRMEPSCQLSCDYPRLCPTRAAPAAPPRCSSSKSLKCGARSCPAIPRSSWRARRSSGSCCR